MAGQISCNGNQDQGCGGDGDRGFQESDGLAMESNECKQDQQRIAFQFKGNCPKLYVYCAPSWII